ncbi:hypothetical protein E2562_039196 [Oryza meyeriana var. granulata]|uniref:Uncharacterized protein n=1 Tax=Oryza meyeriana var. granulata TaxID=110450 RepID=A0A6G1C1F9_9ORYZ|nr:hypothetical protein E2562_039196 [Oryza meyeriana var. granulata]KAF0894485.1 hypothetical protein E2562_039196 [Oryza meyeriana var. granulata]
MLELGIWIIPMTLVFVPCRRLVVLIAKLQQLEECIARRGPPLSPETWSRVARLPTMTIMV